MDFVVEFCEFYFLGTTSGVAVAEDFGALLDAIFEDARWQPGMCYILDHSNLDGSQMTPVGVQRFAEISRGRRAKARAARSAIVAPGDMEYGLSRMWSVFVDDGHATQTAVVRTREEALAWISGQLPAQ